MPSYQPITNPAAHAIEVTADDGTQFQILQIRGESRLWFIPKVDGHWVRHWHEIVNPERIAPNPSRAATGRAQAAALLAYAQAFTTHNPNQ